MIVQGLLNRRGIALRAALLASAFSFAATAAAQELSAGATAPAASALAAADTPDIVVTAQRRAERLQDVPLSVSAVTGEQLRNAQITTADRLEQIVPGVRIGRSGSDLRPAIRGTYTENVAVNGDPRIGIYVDEIYQSRTSQVPPVVDLERVEVQKGPQGTLYGRNSFGGNIAFYSATPKDAFGAGVDLTYGRYNDKRVEGFVNAPLADGIALRIAGLYEKEDGYITNLNANGNNPGGQDTYYIRGTLRFVPKALDEKLEVLLRASYQNYGGSGLGGFYVKVLGTPVDPSYVTAPGGSLTRNGTTYTFPNGFNGASFSGNVLLPVDSRYRDGIPDLNGADLGLSVPSDPYTINSAGKIANYGSQQAYNGQLNYDGGAFKLRSITSYTDFDLTRTGGSLTPVLLNFSYLQTKAKTFTEEVQLLSGHAEDRFQYIVGFYYYNDDIIEKNVTNVNRSYVTATQPVGSQYYPFNFTYAPTGGMDQTFAYDSLSDYKQRILSYAGYGQLSYRFFDDLTVTGGIRYTSDHKTQYATAFNTTAANSPTGTPAYYAHNINDPVNFSCGGLVAANPASNASAATIAAAYKFYCASTTQNFITYRGAVDYKFNRNHMVYASYSTGEHSGGFNTGVVSGTLIPYSPEKVEAFEVGTKNSLMSGMVTLNAAFFLNNYRNLQAQTSIPNPLNAGGVLALVQNIGRDHAYGLDLESTIRPSRHLTVNLAFNWLHARELDYGVNTFSYGFCSITNCTPGSGEVNTVQGTPFPNVKTDPNRFVPVVDASGNTVVVGGVPQYRYVVAGRGRDGTVYVSRKAFAADYTAQVGVSYNIGLGNLGSLTPEAQLYFSSDYILTDLTPNFGNQKAFTKTDLRLTYRTPDERFRLQAFVNNVEDTATISRAVYAANRTLQALYAPPRTYGVTAGYRF